MWGVCKKGVGSNSILCNGCSKWIHKKCSKISGKVEKNTGFRCEMCLKGETVGSTGEKMKVSLLDGIKVDYVDRFCNLGDMLGKDGGVEEATRARVKNAWRKLRELSMILTKRKVSCG